MQASGQNFGQARGGAERGALVFNVQKYNTYDGPGVRTVVFFKGCPLRCQWCSNPEGLAQRFDVMLKRDACTHCGLCAQVCPVGIHKEYPVGEHFIDRALACTGCRACEEICPAGALRIAGEYRSIDELLDVVLEDVDFYRASGGGVTLGGGEALMQPEAAFKLLEACKARGIDTAIETSGYASKKTILSVAPLVDLFLYDLKHIDTEQHQRYTGVPNEQIIENLMTLLEGGFKVVVRLPLLAGLNDSEDVIERMAALLAPHRRRENFQGVHLLPYHRLGVGKYQQLDMPYLLKSGDETLPEETIERIEAQFSKQGIAVRTIRH